MVRVYAALILIVLCAYLYSWSQHDPVVNQEVDAYNHRPQEMRKEPTTFDEQFKRFQEEK